MFELAFAFSSTHAECIKNAYVLFEDKILDEMYSHFINKRIPDFWKAWNAKFRKNISKQVNINGHVTDVDVANEFAVYFKQVFHSTHDNAVYNDYLCSVLQTIISNQMRPRRLRGAWFSRLLRHPARRRSGSILSFGPTRGWTWLVHTQLSCAN